MYVVKHPKEQEALKEGRKIKFQDSEFFILREPTAPGQGEISYKISFFGLNDVSAYDVLHFSIGENVSHEEAIDHLIHQAIYYISN